MKPKAIDNYILIPKKLITIILSPTIIVLCSKLLLNYKFYSRPFDISIFKITKLVAITACTVFALYKLLNAILKFKEKNNFLLSVIVVNIAFCCCQLYAEKGGVSGTEVIQVILWTLLYAGRTIIISISISILLIYLYNFIEKKQNTRKTSKC